MKAEVTVIVETAPEGGVGRYAQSFLAPTVKEKALKKQKRILGKLLN